MLKIVCVALFLGLLAACGGEVVRYDLPPGDSPKERIAADNDRWKTEAGSGAARSARSGPPFALGFQLTHGLYPVATTGACRLRLDAGGILAARPYFVWNTYTPASVMRSDMRPTNLGFSVPFDQQGGVQITLNQAEWQQLRAKSSMTVSFWMPRPFSGELWLLTARSVPLQVPDRTDNLLAARIRLPRQCGPFPRPLRRGERNVYDEFHRNGGKWPYE